MEWSISEYNFYKRSTFHFKSKIDCCTYTPQVQLGAEKPISEIQQAAENMHIDQFVQVIPIIIEQPVEQHNP